MGKIFRISVILFSFLASTFCIAQINEANVLKDENFIQLKKDAIKFYSSSDYLDFKKLEDDFKSKLPSNYFSSEKDFSTWIRENFKESKFNNIDEAIDQYQSIDKLKTKYDKLESRIFDQISDLKKIYGQSLVLELYNKEIVQKLIDMQLKVVKK